MSGSAFFFFFFPSRGFESLLQELVGKYETGLPSNGGFRWWCAFTKCLLRTRHCAKVLPTPNYLTLDKGMIISVFQRRKLRITAVQ